MVGTTRSGWIGYVRELVQNRCLNIATVKPVNPVFNIYGVYGIYGHTFLTLILLILLYPRQICRVFLSITPPLWRGGRVGSFLPSEGEAGRGLYYVITMILLCYSKHFVIHWLKLWLSFFDRVKHKSCDKFAHITKKHYLCTRINPT